MWLKGIFSILFSVAIIFPLTASSPFSLPVDVVILDAGHGGYDPGAVALQEGIELLEKDIALDLTLRVAAHLRIQDPNLNIFLTREDDRYVRLEERANKAAQFDAGLENSVIFVSVHGNSSDSKNASGFEVLLKKTAQWVRFLDVDVADWEILRYANFTASELNKSLNRENLLFATAMNTELAKALPEMRNRGIKEQDVWVLHATKVPSVLVEVGFLSNPVDASYMTQDYWLNTMAKAIGNGILSYINYD